MSRNGQAIFPEWLRDIATLARRGNESLTFALRPFVKKSVRDREVELRIFLPAWLPRMYAMLIQQVDTRLSMSHSMRQTFFVERLVRRVPFCSMTCEVETQVEVALVGDRQRGRQTVRWHWEISIAYPGQVTDKVRRRLTRDYQGSPVTIYHFGERTLKLRTQPFWQTDTGLHPSPSLERS